MQTDKITDETDASTLDDEEDKKMSRGIDKENNALEENMNLSPQEKIEKILSVGKDTEDSLVENIENTIKEAKNLYTVRNRKFDSRNHRVHRRCT